MTEKEMQAEIEESYEHGLPDYLQDDLDNYKKAVEENRKIDACFLWGELYGSINAAQIGDGSITPEQADYLRNKYLWR